MSRVAEFYSQESGNTIRCKLCPHNCWLEDQQTGLCRGRSNQQGRMIVHSYSRWIGIHTDPIEKKPLYHFRPGSRILSLGPNSCNLSCDFCQNYECSQQQSPTLDLSPEELRDLIISQKQKQVAFTYSEPLTAYEFILDFARLDSGIDIVLISNGFINPEPLALLLPLVRAWNIDLKSMRESFYNQRCGGALAPVLATIRSVFHSGAHLELTNLLIPCANDDPAEISDLIDFCADLSPDLPLHFSAYHPAYKSSEPATPPESIRLACEMAASKLHNVYAGNLGTKSFCDTLCPVCGNLLISRSWNRIENMLDSEGSCPHCGKKVYGVFSA